MRKKSLLKGQLEIKGCQLVIVGYLVVNRGCLLRNRYNPGIHSGSFKLKRLKVMKYCFIRIEALTLTVELTGAIYKGNFAI